MRLCSPNWSCLDPYRNPSHVPMAGAAGMAQKALRLTWRDGNRIDLLRNGGEFFPALCQAIDQAQRHVHLETYIFNLDRTGLLVLDHLRQACERGVKVRVVIDGFGSQEHAPAVAQKLAEMGAQYRMYPPKPHERGRTSWRGRR